MPQSTLYYLIWLPILFDICKSDQECELPNAVYSVPGHVAFMGIFNLHSGDNCSIENPAEFDTVQNAIQTIKRLNVLGNIVPEVEIGLNLYDACSTHNKAEKAVVNALFDIECSQTYSLGLLTTPNVSKALTSIINNLHLPQVVLNNEYTLDFELLFNASFSFLQSIRMTTIHMAILPTIHLIDTFSNLATTYRLCVNNPMAYNHIEDSKDKILPSSSEYDVAMFVGTLQDYLNHSQYVTSMSRNTMFIPTNIPYTLEKAYFKALKNGTFITSPYIYNDFNEQFDQSIKTEGQEHPFIQKLNNHYEFTINMKFIQNSLQIYQKLNQFKLKYNEECNGKHIKNCTDLKPQRAEINTADKTNGKRIKSVNDFIQSFQVDNSETSINGINIYRIVNDENEEKEAIEQTMIEVKDTEERIENDKKILLMEINNTNFENIEKRDLILNSIHIVTSEKYDDMGEIEKTNPEKENEENRTQSDKNYTVLEKIKEPKSIKNEFEIQEMEYDTIANDTQETDMEGNKKSSHLNNNTNIIENLQRNQNEEIKLIDLLEDLNKEHKIDTRNEKTNKNASRNNDEVLVISTQTSANLTTNESLQKKKQQYDSIIMSVLKEHREQRLKEIIALDATSSLIVQSDNGKDNENYFENWSKSMNNISRNTRDIKEQNSVKVNILESIAKYNYINNTWIILIEDEHLDEGNEQYLCKIISEDTDDNSTDLEIGKTCNECFNFREIYQMIELNKQEIEANKKRLFDLIYKIEFDNDSFIVCITSLSVIGVISCLVIFTFIMYRIFKRDVLEGNPTITILLLLSIIYNYIVITPFIVNIKTDIEYYEYFSNLLCYVRLISIITSFNFIFSLLLTRCLMLSFCDHDGALMSHINGYIQSSFCFFITIIQILFLINLFLIKYIFNIDFKCENIDSNYVFMLSYNIILLVLLLLTIPFIYKCKRNYFEGVYLTITILAIVTAWFIWIYLYTKYKCSKSILILGVYMTSTIILTVIFIPRTYHMIINIVRDNITSILPALSSQYNTGGSIHNIHYRSTQALYDIVNDNVENKQLGEINPYYLTNQKTESKLRPNSSYYTSRNQTQQQQTQIGQGNPYSPSIGFDMNDVDDTSVFHEDEPGHMSSLSTRIRSPLKNHKSPNFKCRVKSPSIKSRANSPPQFDNLYDTSRYDTLSTMTRF